VKRVDEAAELLDDLTAQLEDRGVAPYRWAMLSGWGST